MRGEQYSIEVLHRKIRCGSSMQKNKKNTEEARHKKRKQSRGYITKRRQTMMPEGPLQEINATNEEYYSAMVSISPDLFFVKKRFSDVKLRRFESRFVDASDKLLILVGGRVELADSGDCSVCPEAGDMAPSLPDIEPFGVLRFLLGKRPNCALCRDDMDEPERGDASVGDMTDAPDTEE